MGPARHKGYGGHVGNPPREGPCEHLIAEIPAPDRLGNDTPPRVRPQRTDFRIRPQWAREGHGRHHLVATSPRRQRTSPGPHSFDPRWNALFDNAGPDPEDRGPHTLEHALLHASGDGVSASHDLLGQCDTGIDRDRLRNQITFESGDTVLPPDAGLLETTERRVEV